jgi:peptidoglycan/xylan/chitin deacetylase (PgdA/CDA1 family)
MNELQIPILFYHRIAELPAGDALKPFGVTPRRFARQMKYLADRGYRSLALTDLASMRSRPRGKCFVLTLDDGYLDNYELAFPILQLYGFQATIFLVSDWLENNGRTGPAPAAMLSRAHVLEMSQHGITFGAHSRTHRPLTELMPEEVWAEVAGSKEDLERTLGLPVTTFSYPYGLSNRAVQETVRACGYDLAVAVDNGTGDLFNLRRIEIGAKDSSLSLAWQVSGWPLRVRRRWRASFVRRIVRRAGSHD